MVQRTEKDKEGNPYIDSSMENPAMTITYVKAL